MFSWFNRNRRQPLSKRSDKTHTIEKLVKVIGQKEKLLVQKDKKIQEKFEQFDQKLEKLIERLNDIQSINGFHSAQGLSAEQHHTLPNLAMNTTYSLTNDSSSIATSLAQRVDDILENESISSAVKLDNKQINGPIPSAPSPAPSNRTAILKYFMDEEKAINQNNGQITSYPSEERHLVYMPSAHTIPPSFIDTSAWDRISTAQLNLTVKNLPKYNGEYDENIEDWFYAMDRFFSDYNVPESVKAKFASRYLENNASYTFQSIERTNPNMNWFDLKNLLIQWFQPDDYQSILRNKLVNLTQKDKVHDYIHEFDRLNNHIRNMAEEDRVNYFISGLNPFIAGFVKHNKCTSLIEAKMEALRVECNFGKEAVNTFSYYKKDFKDRNGYEESIEYKDELHIFAET